MTLTEVKSYIDTIQDSFYIPTDDEKAFLYILLLLMCNNSVLSSRQETYLLDIVKKAEEFRDDWSMCPDFFTGFEYTEDIH